MIEERVGSQRLAYILLALVAWVSLTSAAFSLATSNTLNAFISGLVGIAAIAAAIDGRVVKMIEGRVISTLGLMFLAAIAVVVVAFELGNLRTWDLVVDGEVRIPAVIRTVQTIGSLVLAVTLVAETIRILRSQ